MTSASAKSDARFREYVKAGSALGARAAKPFGRGRPWFAADAGPMQIREVTNGKWICLRRVNADYEIRRLQPAASLHV